MSADHGSRNLPAGFFERPFKCCRLLTGEVARQNHITQQILAQYLQRRLFPQLTSSTTTTTTTQRPPLELGERPPEDVLHTPENLDEDETEQVSNVYDNESSQGARRILPACKATNRTRFLFFMPKVQRTTT